MYIILLDAVRFSSNSLSLKDGDDKERVAVAAVLQPL